MKGNRVLSQLYSKIMELLKRTTLHYQDSKSDKIYEVDLCQVDNGEYVVHFRYGRRGSKLREETKTPSSVSLEEAEKCFKELVTAKTKKKYQVVTDHLPTLPTLKPKSLEEAILNRLQGKGNLEWKLSRSIWRAGEVKLKSATPYLLSLLGSGDSLQDYCLLWALGHCGDSSIVEQVDRFVKQPNHPPHIQRIGFECLLKLSQESRQKQYKQEKINCLPEDVKQSLLQGNSQSLTSLLERYFNSADGNFFSLLDTLYQIDDPISRPLILFYLKTLPFQPNYFKAIRHLLKIAEYRYDGEVLGIILARIDKTPANYRQSYWGVTLPGVGYIQRNAYQYDSVTGRSVIVDYPLQKELESPNSRLCYSNKTRRYLQGRSWRFLQDLGNSLDRNYVTIATELLLQYHDSDQEAPRKTTQSRWNYSNWTKYDIVQEWDSYGKYLLLGHILYQNSSRYELKHNAKAWRVKNTEIDLTESGEAFPQLWRAYPSNLLKLLLESDCQVVHQFAVNILADCNSFCQEINLETWIKILKSPYEITVKFAFDILQTQGILNTPELLLVLINCCYSVAREKTQEILESNPSLILNSPQNLLKLITADYGDTRQFVRKFLETYKPQETQCQLLIGMTIAEIMTYTQQDSEKIADIRNCLLLLTPYIQRIGFKIINDLLSHPVLAIQELGGYLLLNHQTPAQELPSHLLKIVIDSEYDTIRSIGISIISQFPDSILLQQPELLLGFITHETPSFRQSIYPAIQRLTRQYPQYYTDLLSNLIKILLSKEKFTGLHEYILTLIKTELKEWEKHIDKTLSLRLLNAKSSATQELGGLALKAHYHEWVTDFEIPAIVKLANHDILAVRQASWEIFKVNLSRLKTSETDKLSAIRILESKWEDTRKFAWEFFQTNFTENDWTPYLLVTLCDSIKEDVRRFGRELVLQYFNSSYGQDYLLKFSEHPSADMQLFATQFLENYAVNNSERLEQLTPYFTRVLCQVNKGKITKEKVFAFLRQESIKNQLSAQIVADILTRQSLTISIMDKAKCLQIMLEIQQHYPQITLPIQVKSLVMKS